MSFVRSGILVASTVVALVLGGCGKGGGAKCGYSGHGFCVDPIASAKPQENPTSVTFDLPNDAPAKPAQYVVMWEDAWSPDRVKSERAGMKAIGGKVTGEGDLPGGGFFVDKSLGTNEIRQVVVVGKKHTFTCLANVYVSEKAALPGLLDSCKTLRSTE